MDCGEIPPPVIQVQNVSFRYKDDAVSGKYETLYSLFQLFYGVLYRQQLLLNLPQLP